MEEGNFKLNFSRDYFSPNAPVFFKKSPKERIKRFFNWCGFFTNYQCMVMEEPTAVDDGFTYELKPTSKTIHWFYVPVLKLKVKSFGFQNIKTK